MTLLWNIWCLALSLEVPTRAICALSGRKVIQMLTLKEKTYKLHEILYNIESSRGTEHPKLANSFSKYAFSGKAGYTKIELPFG